MKRRHRLSGLAASAIFVFFLAIMSAAPQSPSPVLSLGGKVKTPLHLTLDDLKKMPPVHEDAAYETERGPAKGSYTGVLLWSLIAQAGGIDDAARGAAVRYAIRITATDGYVVVTSTGEIDPDFGGRAALVAYERDGKPLKDFRVVMPGDKKGGRNIHDVVTITIE
jgi:DMSO/TMAO reductase YedYZ molybdopterin-dependent catalytic subunit